MNTKAVQILNQVQAYPATSIAYLLSATFALVCCGYIISIASYFVAAGQNSVVSATHLSEDVLTQLGTIRDSRLSEISGIAYSARYPDTYWVHNDSGNSAELFLIDRDATVLVTVQLTGATNRDWEDICQFNHGDNSYICVGDVGDNRGKYDDYSLYLLKEPEVDVERLRSNSNRKTVLRIDDFSKIEFKYSDGPKNCEAFAFDSASRCFLFAEKGFDNKRNSKPGMYQLQLDSQLKKSSNTKATRFADCKVLKATAMSISDDGRRAIISSYAMASVWNRTGERNWATTLNSDKGKLLPMPVQRQGEAISLDGSGDHAVTTSEHTGQPLWQIKIDDVINTAKSAGR